MTRAVGPEDAPVQVTVVAEGLAHPEGPDVLPDGRLVFVETFRERLSTWSATEGVRPYAVTGGAPNACMVGSDGVYVTQAGHGMGGWRSTDPKTPSIVKLGFDGAVETVTATAGGAPLQAPNDLTFAPDGRLYFTDPGPYDPSAPCDGRVCVVDPDGSTHVLEEVGPSYPNGIVAADDGSIVWVESYTRRVWRRSGNGATSLLATLDEDHIPDGLKIARNGDLYITGVTSGGLDVLSADGTVIGFIHTGGEPQNCVFDGLDLYVADFGEVPQFSIGGMDAGAACGRLLRLALDIEGQPLFRGTIKPGRAGGGGGGGDDAPDRARS